MARSESQRKADERYRQTHPGKYAVWGTTLPPEDVAELEAVRKQSGKGRADFLRWATEQLKRTINAAESGN